MSHRMNSLAVSGMANGLCANDRFWDALSRKRSGTIWYWTPKLLEVSVQLRAARFVPFRFVGSAGLIQALTDEAPQGCRTVRLLQVARFFARCRRSFPLRRIPTGEHDLQVRKTAGELCPRRPSPHFLHGHIQNPHPTPSLPPNPQPPPPFPAPQTPTTPT